MVSHRQPGAAASSWHLVGVVHAVLAGSGTMFVMGLLCDYFVAPSDEAAASVVESGPVANRIPVASEPAQRRGLFHRRTRAAPPAPTAHELPPTPEPQFPSVDGRGVEPTVQMSTLEALLSGRTYEDVEAQRSGERPVALRDGGERMVLRLPDGLAEALAGASETRLTEVALPWSQTEEFWGQGDPDELVVLLRELAELARTARGSGHHLYCWVCV